VALIGDNLKNDLDWIRDIRNQFAHSTFHIDFKTAEISDAVDQLYAPLVLDKEEMEKAKPRDKFMAAVMTCDLHLMTLATGEEQQIDVYVDPDDTPPWPRKST
jgi:hypothetical protein